MKYLRWMGAPLQQPPIFLLFLVFLLSWMTEQGQLLSSLTLLPLCQRKPQLFSAVGSCSFLKVLAKMILWCLGRSLPSSLPSTHTVWRAEWQGEHLLQHHGFWNKMKLLGCMLRQVRSCLPSGQWGLDKGGSNFASYPSELACPSGLNLFLSVNLYAVAVWVIWPFYDALV